jgi:hypothetical protein
MPILTLLCGLYIVRKIKIFLKYLIKKIKIKIYIYFMIFKKAMTKDIAI